ncbi:hypothetical protein [Sphaerisporangium corydalis]|uniref:AAA+ ATPase domain-containing protein n=1 Tax=Sphaerisporangium corydalis TaxID=1441875 RepID=A0ABV9EDW5_9ACTN|nr:hypothetical protein [Sphaerisporangium corydalis]
MSSDQGRRPGDPHSIAIWGAPGSGKTTFLAALNIALILKNGPWRIIGADPGSLDFLKEMTDKLTHQRRFPEATSTLSDYRWLLSRRPEEQVKGLLGRRKGSPAWRIGVNVLDAPGRSFGAERTGHGTDREALIDELALSRGIVYLFDPIRELTDGDAFSHLHGVLADLAGRMLAKDEFGDDMLPHYLAVCVTKFDEIKVLETAEKLGLLGYPEDVQESPRVDDEDAEELFRELCAASPSGNARLVLPTLNQFFHPERIKFFVTSSIGFYVDPEKGRFDPDDVQNLTPEASADGPQGPGSGNRIRIRGPVGPINVMEPMIWLGQRMAGEQQGKEAGG